MDMHHTPDAARFFREMAVNETKHGTELTERRQKLFPTEPRKVTRDMLWDVEAPGYEAARMFMTAHDAMDVALEAEVKAHDYFAAALQHVKDPDVKALFTELRDEETEHQDMVKAAMTKLPPRPVITGDDVADEPVSQ
jgi:demethoxyubiquinone hydroxylase (CLK1/Coq7/Cat5 family)